MTLEELNHLPIQTLKEALQKCCGASNWINKMAQAFPINDLESLLGRAEKEWDDCAAEDWKEAFTHHPKIGDIDSLAKKFAATAQWASGEQQAVNTATQEVLTQLANANSNYENKFGYIFIICASGKTAEKMLQLLQERLGNSPATEIKIAMKEQNKITQLRLQKLLA